MNSTTRLLLVLALLMKFTNSSDSSIHLTTVEKFLVLRSRLDDDRSLDNRTVEEVTIIVTRIHEMMDAIVGDDEILHSTCNDEDLWAHLLEIMFGCEKFQASVMKRATFLTMGDGQKIVVSRNSSSASSSLSEEEEEQQRQVGKRSAAAQETFRIQLERFMTLLDQVEEFARCGKLEMGGKKGKNRRKTCSEKFKCSMYHQSETL